jgi:Ca2+-binding RTX toxin-like protein
VTASNFNDTIAGSSGNDNLIGYGGADIIDGRAGDDTLDGGDGTDLIQGGDGNDLLIGGGNPGLSEDTLVGGGGNDTLTGGNQIDRADYSSAPNPVTVNLDTGTASDGQGGTDTLISIEQVVGSAYADWIFGNASANRFDGGDGNDTITGGPGGLSGPDAFFGEGGNDLLIGTSSNDFMDGGDGEDTLSGGGGNDTLSGGNQIDLAEFMGAAGPVFVNLETGTATDGLGGTDTLSSIERVVGGRFNDTLIGGPGNDTLTGGGGDDSIHGGAGTDYVQFAGNSAEYSITVLPDGSVTVSDTVLDRDPTTIGNQNDGTDTLDADVEIARFADIDMNLGAVAGNDLLLGTAGDDSLFGGDGADTLVGGGGNDTLDGGNQIDMADYATSAAPVVVNLDTGSATDGLGGTDVLISIEQVRGSPYADFLVGGNGNDLLIGGGSPGLPEDTMVGGAGNDTLTGSGQIDRVDYSAAPSAVIVNLGTGTASDGQGGTDTLISIEQVVGSAYGDNITGSPSANRFDGGDGNDTITGGLSGPDSFFGDGGSDLLVGTDSNDFMDGGDGEDTLVGGAGNDFLNGGNQIDLVNYTQATGAVTVNLETGTASDGQGGTDTLISIEQVLGSVYGDSITGSASADQLDGISGDDTLTGGAGDDTLFGGAGNDTLDGGNQIDVANYGPSTGPVTVNLEAGTASDGQGGTDTLISIEQVFGSDYADSITGGASADWLDGGQGDDTITGAGGPDVFLGNGGNDSLTGGSSNDSLGGGLGDDTLVGGAGSDVLNGDQGNDIYKWEINDHGTVAVPDMDLVFLFEGPAPNDKLDLRDVLVGESHTGVDPGNLANYLHFDVSGGNTTVQVQTQGSGGVDLQITILGFDATQGGTVVGDNAIIGSLFAGSRLITD